MNKQYVAGTLALFSLFGFLAILFIMMFQAIPEGNTKYFDIALVGLLGLCTTSFGYYLGSSQGSRLKTELANTHPTEPNVE